MVAIITHNGSLAATKQHTPDETAEPAFVRSWSGDCRAASQAFRAARGLAFIATAMTEKITIRKRPVEDAVITQRKFFKKTAKGKVIKGSYTSANTT